MSEICSPSVGKRQSTNQYIIIQLNFQITKHGQKLPYHYHEWLKMTWERERESVTVVTSPPYASRRWTSASLHAYSQERDAVLKPTSKFRQTEANNYFKECLSSRSLNFFVVSNKSLTPQLLTKQNVNCLLTKQNVSRQLAFC